MKPTILKRLLSLEAFNIDLSPHARALIYQLRGATPTAPELREAARLRGTREVLILRGRVDASETD